MTADRKAENGLRLYLKELGPSRGVETSLRNYGNVRTRSAYAAELCLYFRWLMERGVTLSPDDLIQDNLRAAFESSPTDVAAKRNHTDLLGDYMNEYLIVQREDSEAKRSLAAAAIRGFYSSNDSALFGHWRQSHQKPAAPPAPLTAEDIRKVLLAMPVARYAQTVEPLKWTVDMGILSGLGMVLGIPHCRGVTVGPSGPVPKPAWTAHSGLKRTRSSAVATTLQGPPSGPRLLGGR